MSDVQSTKVCSKCCASKPIELFYVDSKKSNGGRRSECKACSNAYHHDRYVRIESDMKPVWRERSKGYKLKTRYGVDQTEYARMLSEQGGCCAICRTDVPSKSRMKRFYVDHDHETGKVRGLLCHRCNGALGVFGDNIAGIMKVLAYLRH